MCQNTTMRVCGACIKTDYVLCSKTYSSFGNVLYSRASSRQAAGGAHICEIGLFNPFNQDLVTMPSSHLNHQVR